MSQVINIQVKEKIATTDFEEVVSANSEYRLHFDFDSEWSGFSSRVAVVMWADGGAEQLFTGTECKMPAIASPAAEEVLLGVYSRSGDSCIASSFVRLRCRAGAFGVPQKEPAQSLHDQILSFVNDKDWSLFDEKIASGVYSAVRVNPLGLVTQGYDIIEVGKSGQSAPSKSLAVGGIFFRYSGGVHTPYYRTEIGIEPLKLSGADKQLKPLKAGKKSYDGSVEVVLTANDFSLAKVATSGSYTDLTDKPADAVASVNGKTGAVVLSAEDLGLADVATSGSYNDLKDKPAGGDGAVSSVNGKTGEVVLSAEDLSLGALAMVDRVATANLQNLCVTTEKLASGAVQGSRIGSKVIASQHIMDEGISAKKLKSGLIVAGKNTEIVRSDDGVYTVNAEVPVTSVNGQTGEVTVSKYDLGLPEVAITGSYNDLTDRPETSGGVTSVNGQTGEVTVSKYDLGLENVTSDRQMPLGVEANEGADCNSLTSVGFFEIAGTQDSPCQNAPVSFENGSQNDCSWFVLVLPRSDGAGIMQLAFSCKGDNAVRVRYYFGGSWDSWKNLYE